VCASLSSAYQLENWKFQSAQAMATYSQQIVSHLLIQPAERRVFIFSYWILFSSLAV
jgi:hypothetical protein